jgi:hypothetical protein
MWLSYWTANPSAAFGSKSHYGEGFFVWLFVGGPLVIVTAVIARGLWAFDRDASAAWAAFASYVWISLAYNGLQWFITPERWPTRTDRILSGWPVELLILVGSIAWAFQ